MDGMSQEQGYTRSLASGRKSSTPRGKMDNEKIKFTMNQKFRKNNKERKKSQQKHNEEESFQSPKQIKSFDLSSQSFTYESNHVPQHQLDINIFEYKVLSFQETIDNMKNGGCKLNSDFEKTIVDIENILGEFMNVLADLILELKAVENSLKQLHIQSKQCEIKVVDRGLHCLIKGLECLDIHFTILKSILVNNESESLDQFHQIYNNTRLDTINKLWQDTVYIIQDVTIVANEVDKKDFDMAHVHDIFSIIIRLMMQISSSYKSNWHIFVKDKFRVNKLLVLGQCLKYLIQGFGQNIHGESFVASMIESVLIPLLEIEYLMKDQNIDQILELQLMSMECVIVVFRWRQLSSAILSPTIMVLEANSKKESPCPNLLRLRLLRSLIAILNSEEFITKEHNSFLCSICNCLYVSLDRIYAIELSHKNKNIEDKNKLRIDHLEIAAVFRWVHKSIQVISTPSVIKETSIRWHALRLLTCITKLYPQGCAQYWALFFPQASSSPKKSNTSVITLITILSDDKSPFPTYDEKIQCIISAKNFVDSLPIDMWSRSGYLMNRVEASLLQFIHCCRDQLAKKQPIEYMNELLVAAKCLIIKIPYNVYKGVIEAGVLLISQLGEYYLLNKENEDETVTTSLKVLADCFGGVETPQGGLTPLPLPTEIWLRRSLSSVFVDKVFRIIARIDSTSLNSKGLANLEVNLLTHMVRTVSWVVLENETRLKNFVALSRVLISSDNNKMKLTGVQMISAFVEGKRNATELSSNSKTGSQSMILIYQCLYQMLLERNSSILSCTLSAYGNLQYSDWLVLINQDPNPLKLILKLCIECTPDRHGNVKSEACRSIGNVVTECLESIRNIYHEELRKKIFAIVRDSIDVTAFAVKDTIAGVRSMALFAIGNIAFTITGDDFRELRESLPLINITTNVYKCLFDENDKVVGNAIRTLGHLFAVLCQQVSHSPVDCRRTIELCGKAAIELGRKIELAINDVTDTLTQRSWRQRSYAKKHAWGACQALSSILRCNVVNEDVIQKEVKSALQSMIKCIQNSQLINEKIAFGAVSTLLVVPINVFECHSNFESIGGLLLAVCLSKMEASEILSSYRNELLTLMEKLVRRMNQFDMMTCLSHEDISRSNVQFMYNWMVEKNMDASCFENVAEALQFSSFSSDVDLIQKFTSRAEKKKRDELASNGNPTEQYDLHKEDDEDEDEL